MQPHLLFWPVLVVLTIPIFVLMLNGMRKAADRKAGEVDPNAAIDNKAWSLPVILTSNALANQFQLPIVFYVLSIILYQLNAVTAFVLVLAWGFAIARWLHAIVHVTSNSIPKRFGAFLVSSLVLLVLFITTVITLAQF